VRPRLLSAGCLGAVAFLLAPAVAERVPLSPEELKAEASVVVQATVEGVYARDAASTLYGPGTVETQYLIELKVTKVEKGKEIKEGDHVFAHVWRLKTRGTEGQRPGPSGHFLIPTEGATVRAFLTGGDDRSHAVVYANGLEELAKRK
jgi:hypothetical protein